MHKINDEFINDEFCDTDKTAVAEDSSTCHDRNYIYEIMCYVVV